MTDRCSPIHKARVVYTNNVNRKVIAQQIPCSRPTWTSWWAQANVWHKKRDHRSYATVLTQGKVVVQPTHVHERVKCGDTKLKTRTFNRKQNNFASTISHGRHKVQNLERKTLSTLPKKALFLEENVIPTFNRFQPLQDKLTIPDVEHDVNIVHNVTQAANFSSCMGNKNKTGQTLGTAASNNGHCMNMDSLANNFKGNKNKTGISLGQSISEGQYFNPSPRASFTNQSDCSMHVQLHSKGNKNKTGSKLGHMHTKHEDMENNGPHVNTANAGEVTSDTALFTFSGNKNGNGTKLGLGAVLPQLSATQYLYTQSGHLSDQTVSDVQYGKRTKQIPDRVYAARFQSIDHKNCLYQNEKKFGFIPINDLMVYTGPERIWGQVPNIVEAHAKIKQSGLPNFMSLRIPVQTQLKVRSWEKYLYSYWDQQLLDLIRFGFPLDFDRQVVLHSTETNHNSAIQYAEHVSTYIMEEIKYGAILGPFKQLPFHCHISPFLTRDKPNSNNRRVILDLSFPPGNSVNAGVPKDRYLGSYFELKYPSVDDIVHSLKQLGPTALLYKIDISRAFRHIRIDPGDLDLLGIKHGDYFIDGTLPFGFRHGSVFFQRCTDAIRYIMKDTFQFYNLYNYIDDLIYIGLPDDIYHSFHTLMDLLQDLGLEISTSKLVEPTTVAVCLGIEINTINRTLRIPQPKLQEIQHICHSYVTKNKVTKPQFQSLLGSLLYITKCVKPARFFLNRMLFLLRQHASKNYVILNEDFKKDLNWFNTFLFQYNGITFYDNPPIQDKVFLDASLQGMGGAFRNMVYSLPFPKGFKNYTIVHLEILNIVVALKVWGSVWKDHIIEVKCDNMAVVEVLNTGRARDLMLATSARNIWLLTSMYNIELVVTHIPGVTNLVADLLSRWQGNHHDINKLNDLVPDHQWLPVHIDHTLLNTSI